MAAKGEKRTKAGARGSPYLSKKAIRAKGRTTSSTALSSPRHITSVLSWPCSNSAMMAHFLNRSIWWALNSYGAVGCFYDLNPSVIARNVNLWSILDTFSNKHPTHFQFNNHCLHFWSGHSHPKIPVLPACCVPFHTRALLISSEQSRYGPLVWAAKDKMMDICQKLTYMSRQNQTIRSYRLKQCRMK